MSDAALSGPVAGPAPATKSPGWWRHLQLLWGLRLTLARGALVRPQAALATLAGAVSLTVFTIAACRGTYGLFTSPYVTADPLLERFLRLLLGFLASTMWMTWPVVTASVDDASEISRFSLFPVPPQRLFAASVLAGLAEPRSLPIWGALCGATAAACHRGASIPFALVATLGLGLCGVVWGRVGLHALLNVLRHRRSAEAMGGGLLVLLFCAAFVPPPDLSWLKTLNTAAPAVNDALLRGAVILFTLLPTGGWATVLSADLAGDYRLAAIAFAYMAVVIGIGYWFAYRLLQRFHRRAGRALPQPVDPHATSIPFRSAHLRVVLVERELRDCWLNPRTRLTVALPFFLGILLKLVGARALASALIGPLADGWLLGGLASYGAFVLGAGFAQNCFGYDGGGAQLLLGAPIKMRDVIEAKNVVHGGMAFALCLALAGFYCAYIGLPAGWIVLLGVCNGGFQVLVFLGLGNVLSVISPRKFHPSLKRKDRASALSIAVGLGAASLVVVPGTTLLRLARAGLPIGALVLMGAMLPVVGWVLWRLSIPIALRLLESRRADLLRAVARE